MFKLLELQLDLLRALGHAAAPPLTVYELTRGRMAETTWRDLSKPLPGQRRVTSVSALPG